LIPVFFSASSNPLAAEHWRLLCSRTLAATHLLGTHTRSKTPAGWVFSDMNIYIYKKGRIYKKYFEKYNNKKD
jgi:hypothetical protein